MIVLVCGGRDYFGDVAGPLSLLHIDLMIHGGARGADLSCASWAKSRGIHCAQVDALWDFYGKSAGYKRNVIMGSLAPDVCIAFPGGAGTRMMVQICSVYEIPFYRPYG